MQERGELELRVTKLLQECRQEGNIILMIDEVGGGQAAGMQSADHPAMQQAGAGSGACVAPCTLSSLAMLATPARQIHTLVGAGAVGRGGGGGGLDISNLLKVRCCCRHEHK